LLTIEYIEWDDANLDHATVRATRAEIDQVFANGPAVRLNTRGRSADYVAVGKTDGGRRLVVPFGYDEVRRSARPITAWEE
jgi:hypothetical protein